MDMKLITDLSTVVPVPSVATIGFFDGVHAGHRHLIRQVTECAAERSLSSLLVTFDRHPRQVMQAGYRPALLSTLSEKVDLLSQTGADACALLSFTPRLAALTARDFMRDILRDRLGVQVLVVGYDHHFGHGGSDGFADYVRYGEELGLEVVQAGELPVEGAHISSSLIRTWLGQGDVAAAATALLRPYSVCGTVVPGFHVGRDLGFPTANLHVADPSKLIPRGGVYAVWVMISSGSGTGVYGGSEAGVRYPGMLNIGTRPTLDNGTQVTVEVHLIGYRGDLYGRSLCLEFVARLRDEQRFPSIDALVVRLHEDALQASRILDVKEAVDPKSDR